MRTGRGSGARLAAAWTANGWSNAWSWNSHQHSSEGIWFSQQNVMNYGVALCHEEPYDTCHQAVHPQSVYLCQYDSGGDGWPTHLASRLARVSITRRSAVMAYTSCCDGFQSPKQYRLEVLSQKPEIGFGQHYKS